MNTGIVARIVTIAGVAGLGIVLNGAPARAQQEFGPPELIAAAKAGDAGHNNDFFLHSPSSLCFL